MTMKPSQFYLVSFLMVMIAVSFPIQAMVLYGHGFDEMNAAFAKITWLNWVVIGSLLFGAHAFFHASRWTLFWAPVVLGVTVLNNYLVGQFAGDFSMWETSVASLGIASLFTPLAMPSSRVLLKDPNRRWWRVSKRYHKRVPATLNPYKGEMVNGYTFDISQTGAFVCFEDGDIEKLPQIGDTVRLSLSLNSMKKIRCEAIVVRIAEANGRYPRGMGIRFVDVEKLHQKSFKDFVGSKEIH